MIRDLGALAAMLGLGLASSAHCALMCGALFGACAQGRDRGAARLAGMHLGRLVSYAGLGALAGVVGASVDLGAGLLALPRVAALVAGTALVVLAFEQLGLFRALRFPTEGAGNVGRAIRGPLQRLVKVAFGLRGPWGPAAIGAALGFLPCPVLYGAVALAAASADPAIGALRMGAFAFGGALPLAALGSVAGFAWRRGSVPLNRIAAVLVLALGLGTITGRLSPAPPAAAHAAHMHHHEP